MSWYTFMPKLLNMSLTAGVAVCLVLFLRLFLKKAPKVISYALWSVVLFRLLCPVSIESGFSLYNLFDVPTAESGTMTSVMEYVPENIVHTEYPSVTLPVPGISEAINRTLPQGREQMVADPLEAPMSFTTYIWMLGVLVMVVYSVDSCIRLRGKLLASVRLWDNIFLADDIDTPFVMGAFRPKIYLPSSLPEKERGYILLHEQHHIRRGDPILRLLAFAALCLHWFNPLVWAAFILSGKDMEMSCDEAVLRKLGEDIRVDYTASLISLATGRRIIAGTPLAFGEGDTMGRVKNIAKWKKPAVWVIAVAVIVCIVAVVCLITNPTANSKVTLRKLSSEVLLLPSEESELCTEICPDTVWNLSEQGTFSFRGSGASELFTSGNFIRKGWLDGRDAYIISLQNNQTDSLQVSIFRTADDKKLEAFSVEAGESLVMELLCPHMWYMKLEAGGVGYGNLDFLGSVRCSQEYIMIPTTANVTGAFDSYLYVPLDGANYRYERVADDPASVTKGKRIHTFTEGAGPQNVEWHVYAVGEYPNHSVVLAEAGDDYVQLYRYSPSKAVPRDRLIAAQAAGMITLENGDATSGQELWETFYRKTCAGNSASVKIAHYYTLDNGDYDEKYYEVYKEDYPALYEFELTYDGKTYKLNWEENGTPYEREYQYMMIYYDFTPTGRSSAAKREAIREGVRYVLTNDDTVTWEDLMWGTASSQLGDYIDHFTIYAEKE